MEVRAGAMGLGAEWRYGGWSPRIRFEGSGHSFRIVNITSSAVVVPHCGPFAVIIIMVAMMDFVSFTEDA